ncbi:MAG: hypothetical protein LH629_07695, partial [Ignavibacteria bacterium]|nr:hypothetical protein [Ignavibacteria bacterium]
VCNSLEVIFQQLETSSILLTPHSITPLDSKCVNPDEINFLRSGLYNAGFLGLRRTSNTKQFIDWFKDRLTYFSFNDYANEQLVSRGLFVDQLWLNLVPLYFEGSELCLHPGANFGHWNLFNKSLNKDSDGNITVNGEPLLFIHFSGWDINNINTVSKYSPRDNESAPPLWVEVSKMYRQNLLTNGYEDFLNYPCAFSFFKNGEAVTLEMRSKYFYFITQEEEDSAKYPLFSDAMYFWINSKCDSSQKKNNSLEKISVFTRLTKLFQVNRQKIND